MKAARFTNTQQDDASFYYELLEITEKQEEIIAKQNKLIARLMSDNLEKENIINTLTQYNNQRLGRA